MHRLLNGWDDKSAKAVCLVAFYDNTDSEDIKIFKGEVDGHIVEPRGPTDFGWDPCFQPLGYTKTYAEMDKSIKNQISHRFRAFDSLRQYFAKEFEN